MWIQEISYGTIAGGCKSGLVMFEIVFTGQEPDAPEVSEIVNRILTHPGRKCERVHLTGIFPNSNDGQTWMFSLLGSLRASGFSTFVTSPDGKIYPQWMSVVGQLSVVSWLSVHLHDPIWSPFNFHELIMDLKSLEDPEPFMPPLYDPNVNLIFLNPVGTLSSQDLFTYIQKAKLKWNINIVPRKLIREILVRYEV